MSTLLQQNLDALRRRYGAAPDLAREMPTGAPAGAPALPRANVPLTAPFPAALCIIGANLASAIDHVVAASETCRVLIIEPDAACARRSLERRSWVTWIERGRLAWLVGHDYAGLAEVARQWPDLARAPVHVDQTLSAGRPDHEAAARAALGRIVFQIEANDAARRALSGRYLRHTLANLPRLMREGDAGQLTGAFTNVPALIVAAGPSLDVNRHEILRVADRGVVIACDTAALPLVSAGVHPHAIVAVDASEANARHLSSLPPTSSALVTEGSIHPSAVQGFAGRTFFFKVADHHPWPWLTTLGLDRARLDAWGSVATTAFALALEMGCDPIVFAGADFAFTSERPYCRGTSYESLWASWTANGYEETSVWRLLLDQWSLQQAVDIHGKPTTTAPHLLAFRDWIADRASARADRRVINATDAGVLMGPAIHQTSLMTALGAAPVVPAAAIRQVIAMRHVAPTVDPASVWAAVTATAAGLEDPILERWREFTADAVVPDAMRAILASPEQQAFALGLGLRPRLGRIAS